MKIITIFLLSILLISSGCEKIGSSLPLAKAYTVVGEHDKQLGVKNRKAKMWFITSGADGFKEFAQTSILAAYEIHKENKDIDLIQVILVPDKEFVATSTYYAQASYATDKKGALGLSGVDLNAVTYSKWFVKAAENPLSAKELVIAKLWVTHQKDFPSSNMLSSLSYDREALRVFIADSLQIDISEVELPITMLRDYDELEFIE